MLKRILNVNGVKKLDNKAQKSISGGCPPTHPSTQEACELCVGNWYPFKDSGLCELPVNHFC